MKFLVFVDVHEDSKAIKDLIKRGQRPDIDFIICAGDLSNFGRGLDPILRKFDKLGKKFYLIPGNHEEGQSMPKGNFVGYENCVSLHKRAIKIGNYIFLGYGGDGFLMEDSEFRKISRDWYGKYNKEKIVLVTHGPPFATHLDRLGDRHVGNKDYRKFIERVKPKVAVSGHLHETAGKTDSIGPTKLVNPGWEGMVIELK